MTVNSAQKTDEAALAVTERLRGIRDSVCGSLGWHRRLIAFAAGSASTLAMAPVFFWPVLFLTLPVLVWLIDDRLPDHRDAEATALPQDKPTSDNRIRRAAADGWWFAFGYFFFGLFWIGEAFLVEAHIFGWLLPFAITVMPAGLAIFWAAAAAASAYATTQQGLWRIVSLAIALGLAEWLRGHLFTGFPWNVLGYALTYPEVLMQSAGVIGIYGLTVAAVVIFATPLVMAAEPRTGPRQTRINAQGWLSVVSLSLAPLGLMLGYGAYVMPSGPQPVVNDVRLRIVQPSTPQHEKWMREKQRAIFDEHLDLSRRLPDGRIDDLASITHVVWSEASMPFLPLSSPEALSEIGTLLGNGKYLIAGALRLDTAQTQNSAQGQAEPAAQTPDLYSGKPARPRAYNSLLVFGQGGGLAGIYDKIHLVPFGEYLPLQQTLEAIGLESLTRIRGGFAIGETPRSLMKVPGLPPYAPLICYEAIFPTAVVQGPERPGFLLNVTNDGWFGTITGPFQHFHQTRVRAVEEGLPLVRASNNGVSAVVDPFGRVVERLGLNVRGSIDADLPQSASSTIYARLGDLMLLVSICFFAALASIIHVLLRHLGEREQA